MKSKSHYLLLDGLRGVVAIMVLLYHLFEAIAFSSGKTEQDMFHGFLAVDFFFVLSGFVMGYAYDEKWKEMSISDFIKRRLIRLHPMVVLGVVIGLILFIIQGCTLWTGEIVPLKTVLMTFVLSLFLIPSFGKLDVRGNTELFSLNGPHWSLFFEYIGSILYALTLRKLSSKSLAVWTSISFVMLAIIGFMGPYDSIAYGWSSDPVVFIGGFLRMNFAYSMGLLLSRLNVNCSKSKNSVWIFIMSSLILCVLLSVPSLSWRVVYELIVVAVAFPSVVILAAKADVENNFYKKIIEFLGNISYPLYAIHYPFIYLYIWWLNNDIHPLGNQPWVVPAVIFMISIIVAYLSFILYDRPVRSKLNLKNTKLYE